MSRFANRHFRQRDIINLFSSSFFFNKAKNCIKTFWHLNKQTHKKQIKDFDLGVLYLFIFCILICFHWKVASQMPASLRKCKKQNLWTDRLNFLVKHNP